LVCDVHVSWIWSETIPTKRMTTTTRKRRMTMETDDDVAFDWIDLYLGD
jgi:hypothetical protein